MASCRACDFDLCAYCAAVAVNQQGTGSGSMSIPIDASGVITADGVDTSKSEPEPQKEKPSQFGHFDVDVEIAERDQTIQLLKCPTHAVKVEEIAATENDA